MGAGLVAAWLEGTYSAVHAAFGWDAAGRTRVGRRSRVTLLVLLRSARGWRTRQGTV